MDSKRLTIVEELLIKNSDAYIKLGNWDVLIYSKFLDLEYIRVAMYHYNSGKMKFEMINELPILLDINSIDRNIYDVLHNQLLNGLIPKFESIDDQINYILLLEHLTSGNSSEICEIVKDIKFDPSIYIFY